MDGHRLSLQESSPEAIILWKIELESDTTTATVRDLCSYLGIRVIYAEDVLSDSAVECMEFQKRSVDCSHAPKACSHLSKACWISMSCGENDDAPIGYITEVGNDILT